MTAFKSGPRQRMKTSRLFTAAEVRALDEAKEKKN